MQQPQDEGDPRDELDRILEQVLAEQEKLLAGMEAALPRDLDRLLEKVVAEQDELLARMEAAQPRDLDRILDELAGTLPTLPEMGESDVDALLARMEAEGGWGEEAGRPGVNLDALLHELERPVPPDLLSPLAVPPLGPPPIHTLGLPQLPPGFLGPRPAPRPRPAPNPDATPADVARWMLTEFERDGYLHQSHAAGVIGDVFGTRLLYTNQHGNPAIGREVLGEFRALTPEAVWVAPERYWRRRRPGDPPGRIVW